MGGSLAGMLLGIAVSVVAARALGPQARGEFLATQTWAVSVGAYLCLGVSQALVVDTGSDEFLLGPLLLHTALAGLCGLVLFTLFAVFDVQPWLGPPGVVGAACAVAAAVAASTAVGLAQRRGRMTTEFQVVRLTPGAMALVTFLAFVLVGLTDVGVWLLALGLLSVGPALVFLFRGLGGIAGLRARRRMLPTREFARTARKCYSAVVGTQIAYRLHLLLVAAFMSNEQVAFYGVAASLATACATLAQARSLVMFSQLRSVTAEEQQASLVRQAIMRSAVLATTMAIPLVVCAPVIVGVFYGAEFSPASDVTRILVLGIVPQTVDYLLIHVLMSMSAGYRIIAVQVPVGLLAGALLLVAVRSGSLAGTAWASVAVPCCSAAGYYILMLGLRRRRNGLVVSVSEP
ncbi:hypothetical protein MXD62_32725 [Frankia sp. Mgl5]|uniref:lipopolysaccharide biosynthesis protein n=1 Tax=Frankia sp. Mgl5 TaxID=2933793 RepID=UPI00200F8D70|nr:hypothetical protein [Frankia sp. Mgl5]MCK9931848.1 hypothetical protein [Frankia sp. Mgl5]